VLSLLATPVVAQTQQTAATLQRLQQQLNQQQNALAQQRQALAQTRRQLQQLRLRLQVPPRESASTTTVAQREQAQQPTQRQSVQQPVGKAPTHQQEQAAETVAAVMEQPGVL